MRRLFGKIITIILAVLVIYNYFQISSLKKEVASLEEDLASLRAITVKSQSPSTILDEARKHLDNAKDLALKGNYNKAQSELQKGIECLKKAGQEAGSQPVNAVKSLQKKLQETADSIDAFLKKFDKSKPKNGGK